MENFSDKDFGRDEVRLKEGGDEGVRVTVFFFARGTLEEPARVFPLYSVLVTLVFVVRFSQRERVTTRWRVVGGSSLRNTVEVFFNKNSRLR